MTAHPKVSSRLAAAGLLNLALFSAAFALRHPPIPKPIRVFHAVIPADPLAAEVLRCQNLSFEAAGNPSCEEAFAEGDVNLFYPPGSSLER